VGGQYHAPATLPMGKRPSTHGTEYLVGLVAGLDGTEYLATPSFDPRINQAAASSSADWATPAVVANEYNPKYYTQFL